MRERGGKGGREKRGREEEESIGCIVSYIARYTVEYNADFSDGYTES